LPITDAYATAAEYRDRTTKTDTGDDAGVITPLLAAVSRLIDRETGRFFTKDAAAVARVYEGGGLTRLYIDDVATVSGLVVKVDLNGDYDYADTDETLTKDTHFWIGPVNAEDGSEPKPYRYLDIVPNNGRLSVWPAQLRAVEVTAQFGWAAVPGAIKEATILVAREMRDLQESGMTLSLQAIDQAVNLAPVAFSLIQRIKREYGRKVWFV
jgi:hypothetical protein